VPIRCTRVENRTRPRYWTAKKAGQACCYALKHGATREQIELEIAKCGGKEPRRGDQAEAAYAVAEAALLASNEVFNADALYLQRFLTVTQGLVAVARIIRLIPNPVARAAALGVIAIRELASSRLKNIAGQKAANDAAINVIRRAAANAERFRQTGT